MLAGAITIDSHLHKHLIDHLNAEIVLNTITNLKSLRAWIRSTFLYVRASKCPSKYGLADGLTKEQILMKLEGKNIHQKILIVEMRATPNKSNSE